MIAVVMAMAMAMMITNTEITRLRGTKQPGVC